jgi:hypothetical protein
LYPTRIWINFRRQIMLTRDTEQIQLNEIHALCIEAADHYQAALARECVADMEVIYAEAACVHQKFAAEIAACIRSQDDQPKLPDPDREALELFFTSIKARLATSERKALINDQIKVEEKLCTSIKTALQGKLPLEVKSLLERLLANVLATQKILHDRQ